MVRDCTPDDIGMSVSYPLPGTQVLRARCKHELGDKQNWVDSDDLDMMFQGAYITEFYRVLHDVRAPRVPHAQGRRTAARRAGPPGHACARATCATPCHPAQLGRPATQAPPA